MNDEIDQRNESPPISAGVSQFIEGTGMLMEKYGMPRIGGRILGLLMLDNTPLSLDDIAGMLGVSRASVSTNVRMTEMAGIAERVSRPGDRRDYYVGTDDLWARTLQANVRDLLYWRDVARKALPNLNPDEEVARRRLRELIDFCEFFNDGLAQLMHDWREYKAQSYADIE